MKYLLGLDNGGTATKAAIFSLDGAQIAVVTKKTELLTPHSGFTERNLEDLWMVNVEAIREVLETASAQGIQPSDIAGIGICGHGKGLYMLDREGAPLGNGIVSTDNRAQALAERWTQEIGPEVYQISLQRILACQPVCLLRWLKENEPERYQRIGSIFSVKDYIRYRLTGQRYAERTDLSGSNLLNLTTGEYDERLLELFGITEIAPALLPVRGSFEHCGSVTNQAALQTGLTPCTPVAGGMFDIDACAISAGLLDSDRLCMIAGTWSINEYVSETPVANGRMMNSFYCVDGLYLVEECSPTSAGNLEWFLRILGETDYARCNSLVASVAPEENTVYFLPFVFASNEEGNPQGAFAGLQAGTDRAQMLTAVYEGIVFAHLAHVERLLINREPPVAVRLTGGAAHSDVWAQMFADTLGLTVEIIDDREHGCFGAALAAGVCAGLFPNIRQCVNQIKVSRTFLPNPSRTEVYRKKYQNYRKLCKALAGF